ncbi:MAG: hypothetical protein J1E98_00475 [Lachnospiraceae bacterium]|nr:hypothetical protein [Lachnospiraceae bacterium]
MANVCSDTVFFFPKDDTTGDNILKLKENLLSCYPDTGYSADTRIVLLFKHLNIPTDGIYLRGDIVYMDIKDTCIRLDLETAWSPLYDAYREIASYYGLDFVLRAEEPGERIFINTDIYGIYLDVRYRVLLELDTDAEGTAYEKMLKEETDTEVYFFHETDLLEWFAKYGISAGSYDELEDKLDPDYVSINLYDTVCA